MTVFDCFLFFLSILNTLMYVCLNKKTDESEKEFLMLKTLFESVEKQTDYQYDALLCLLERVIRIENKLGITVKNHENENQ